jgi:hypothetical protein
MPIVDRFADPLTHLASGALPTAPSAPDPSFGSIFGAAFRQNNVIGSGVAMAQNFWNVGNAADSDYNPWDDIKGTPYEENWRYFATSNNARYTEAVKRQIDTEARDRRTLDAGGWTATLANFGANIVDPTVLIPVGGEIIKGAQGVYKILDVGLRSAVAGGVGSAVQEAGLQSTQIERTAEDSLYSIGGGIVLGGLLGGAVSAALSKGERATALKGYDNLLPTDGGGGLSAAPRTEIGMDALTVDGWAAHAGARVTQWLNPNLRLNESPNPLVRQVAQELSEHTLYQIGNREGITTGAAVSRLAKMNADGRMAVGVNQMRAIYGDMKKAGFNMPFDDFDQAVGRAMRSGDEGENEFIGKAAKAWRGSVVEPFFKDGQAVGLYDEGDDVSFAPTYFPRQYRTKVLIAREPEIKAEWSAFMERRIANDYQGAKQRLKDEIDEIDQEAGDLNLSPEQRTQAVAGAANERARVAAENPEHADRLVQIEGVKQRAAVAKEAGDAATKKALDAEARQLRKEGGKEYKAFEAQLKKIEGRSARLSAFDPARLPDLASEVAARRAQKIRDFLDTWEIKRLGENIDPFDPDALPSFKEMSKEIIDEVYGKLTGRDFGASASVQPEYLTPIKRGPVKERTLPIPDWMLQKQGVLEDSATDVLHRYSRTLSADVELSRKFGDPRMDGVLGKIAEKYEELRKGVTDPAALAKLQKRQKADQRDIEALRDLVRGTYRANENASNFARTARVAGHYNFVRHMGGVVVSSFNDLYRPAMVLGLKSFMGDGVAPLLKNAAAAGMSVHEAQLAGTVVERALGQRISTLAGIADPLERGTPIERLMANMSRIGGKWSGITLWNDAMQGITAIMTQNHILGGRFGTRQLAYLGIDPDMAGRIKAQYATHGELLDGVHVANTEGWEDIDAVRAYRAAVGKEVDRIIVAPGIGDLPLFARTPLGKLMLQFRSFTIASHTRVMLAGLQEEKSRFVMGALSMTALGILSAYLSAWRGGQQSFDKFQERARNPGYLVGEGLDRSGIFSLGFDFSNTTEKLASPATGFSFNPLKYGTGQAGRLFVPDAPLDGTSQRFSTRGPAGAILGPTAGLAFEDVFSAAHGGVDVLQGKELSAQRRRAAQSLIPFNSFFGFKEAIQAMNGDSPYAGMAGKPGSENPDRGL